jgi:hypothetical protein
MKRFIKTYQNALAEKQRLDGFQRKSVRREC